MNLHRKLDLLERITQAIYDDGWNLIFLSESKYFPFRLKVYNNTESYNLRIYIWNLTHGGGRFRPKDEYRVQITGVNHFEQDPQEKTLILGWWDEGGVFAGFDYRKHTGILGASPSIQIREEALRKAYINGISPWTKENNEIAVSFRPDFLVEYIRNIESLHAFGESKHDFDVLQTAVVEPDTVNDEVISGIAIARQTALANVVRKVRDNSFKARILTAYGNKCAFCGLQMKLVDAAHIVPVSFPESTDETRNGFALCALHHRAYDKSLVTINRSYKVISDNLKMDKLKEIHLDGGMPKFISALRPIIILPPAISDRPHLEYIRKSNEIRGWKLAT
jgi:putative restriction endonuclease